MRASLLPSNSGKPRMAAAIAFWLSRSVADKVAVSM
jgi:hypothetical protein